MPLYEYECFLCGDRFERIQRFADDPVSQCPACGGAVRRLLGVPALQFKGSGFYITDYGKGKANGNGASASRSETSETTESKSQSDSPPPTKEPKKDAAPKSEAKSSTS